MTNPQDYYVKAMKMFKLYDENKDGVIQRNELGKALRAMGKNPTEAEIDQMFAEADKDGNGVLDFKEFLRVLYFFFSVNLIQFLHRHLINNVFSNSFANAQQQIQICQKSQCFSECLTRIMMECWQFQN